MKNLLLTTILLAFTLFGCKQTKQNHVFENKDKTISLTFNLDKNQRPFYTISHKNNTILDWNLLKLENQKDTLLNNDTKKKLIDVNIQTSVEKEEKDAWAMVKGSVGGPKSGKQDPGMHYVVSGE